MRLLRRYSIYHLATYTACIGALLTTACSDVLSAPQSPAAVDAVTTFTALADSISRAGGDASMSEAYRGLADALQRGGRISPIIISVDGTATTFLATAQNTEFPSLDKPCLSGQPCVSIAPLRTLVAWQESNPRRVIQVTSMANTDPIRAYLFPTLVPFNGPSATLSFFDGVGGTYFGTSGEQSFAVKTSEVPCIVASAPPVIAVTSMPRCTNADFTVAFSAKAEPSVFLAKNNPATGIHSFSMSSQPVLGSRIEVSKVDGVAPPIVVNPGTSLPATLSATVDSVIALTLTIGNPGKDAEITFATSQEYEFTIIDPATGAALWRWSDGRGFFQAFHTRSLLASASLSYTVYFKPPRKGELIAVGSLVSASHRADAKMMVSVK